MGIGDNIRRSAEDALRDLAGLSEPTDDAHAPEPGDPDEGIKVHSSISQGSNAGDVRDGNPGRAPESAQAQAPGQGTSGNILRGDGGDGNDSGAGSTQAREADAPPPRDVPDPGGLRADPSEGESDPSSSMGRG